MDQGPNGPWIDLSMWCNEMGTTHGPLWASKVESKMLDDPYFANNFLVFLLQMIIITITILSVPKINQEWYF